MNLRPAHANWVGADWKSDAEGTCAWLGEMEADWLIVDHYGLDTRWESALRPYCRKFMVIDDLADRQHDCELLLDQNLVADMVHRYDDRVPQTCGTMLGPDYALLQPQYAQLHPRTPPRQGPVRRMLVYFGGADTGNLTGLAIAAFLSLDRIDVAMDVVINPAGSQIDKIREQVTGQQNIRLHAGLPSLAPLMAEADLAIGGGGATSWERCCLGLPALVITLAENQRPIAAELVRHGLIRWLGHCDEVGEEELAQTMREVFDTGLDPAWSESCNQLVDGQGAARVAGYLLVRPGVPLFARLAGPSDESLFLHWANDPLTRGNSFDSSRIEVDTHRAWFRPRLRDIENCRMYVVETADALPIGQVRFTRAGDAWEIHYGLDARCRGRGLGAFLLATALDAARADSRDSELDFFGRVKVENTPSRKIFVQLGFSEESTGSELIYRQSSG